jgi:hypothetical protein
MNVNIFINTYMQQYATVCLSLLMIIWSTAVLSQDAENETSIAHDLYVALTLQGINCDGISQLERSDEDSFDVVCKTCSRFGISQTKDGIFSVVDRLTGIVRKGIGTFIGTVPLTGQIFQQPDKLTEHDAEVARSLFSIIELSGNACDAITGVVSNIPDGHIVSCAIGQNYHVYTREDGLVAVEAVSTDGS